MEATRTEKGAQKEETGSMNDNDKTTFEEMSRRIRQNKAKAKSYSLNVEENMIKRLIKEKRAKPIDRKPNRFHGDCDHPSTIENGTATFFWIVSLLVGAIFKGGWSIWVVSTIIWWKFITRHNK